MFATATRFLTTLQEKFNPLYDDTVPAAYRIDDIRQAMLASLDSEARLDFPLLERRILQAANVPSLWFLRPDLLMALAAGCGEQAARQVIDEISGMFDGLLPQSLNSRPSRLQR